MASLVSMGFPESDAKQALERCAGSSDVLQAAMEYLLSLTAEGSTVTQADAEVPQATGALHLASTLVVMVAFSAEVSNVLILNWPSGNLLQCKKGSLVGLQNGFLCLADGSNGMEQEGQAATAEQPGPSAAPQHAIPVRQPSNSPGTSSKVCIISHTWAAAHLLTSRCKSVVTYSPWANSVHPLGLQQCLNLSYAGLICYGILKYRSDRDRVSL